MKLTKVQAEIMDEIKERIRKARECATFEEYFIKYLAPRMNDAYNTPEKYRANNEKGWNWWIGVWEGIKSGIVVVNVNSRSLKALEKLGLIEIIKDGGSATDTVRVIE